MKATALERDKEKIRLANFRQNVNSNLWSDDLRIVSPGKCPTDVAGGVADVWTDGEAAAFLVVDQGPDDDGHDLRKSATSCKKAKARKLFNPLQKCATNEANKD